FFHWVYWIKRKGGQMKVLGIPVDGVKTGENDPYVELDVKDVYKIKENEKGIAVFYTAFGEFFGLAFSND
ncbi:hypothetical protein, partial [Paenibacillus sp. E194]|uniref:hypothetical protein n=1 Tax=Paenibacillus sp. E194 TaxID=1458845 RepID=UPI000AD30101